MFENFYLKRARKKQRPHNPTQQNTVLVMILSSLRSKMQNNVQHPFLFMELLIMIMLCDS